MTDGQTRGMGPSRWIAENRELRATCAELEERRNEMTQELRLQCLGLAVSSGAQGEAVAQLAEAFERYVVGGATSEPEVDPEPSCDSYGNTR